MENISRTDHVRNEKVLHRVKDERNILNTIKRRKDNWIGHILRSSRLILVKYVIQVRMEGSIQERRCKQLLDDLKKMKYWKLKKEASDCTVWRTGC
jgi:hypothetical protein